MDSSSERRQYHPAEENVPLSEAVREAIIDYENTSLEEDEFDLSEYVNTEAIDTLFEDTDAAGVIVQLTLTDVIVSIWSDGAIDIRVTDPIE